MTTTSNCSLPSAISKTAGESDVPARIANWIRLKKAAAETALAFKAEDEWMEAAREGGLLDEYYDELAEEYDCPGVRWVRSETRRWSKRSYSDELQATIKAYEDANECPASITWRAKLK